MPHSCWLPHTLSFIFQVPFNSTGMKLVKYKKYSRTWKLAIILQVFKSSAFLYSGLLCFVQLYKGLQHSESRRIHGAVKVESSHSCLSASSEQNKYFKQALLCLFPGYFTNGKAIYVFPLSKHINNWARILVKRAVRIRHILHTDLQSNLWPPAPGCVTPQGPCLIPFSIRSLLHYTVHTESRDRPQEPAARSCAPVHERWESFYSLPASE